jgi:hypothetical protein
VWFKQRRFAGTFPARTEGRVEAGDHPVRLGRSRAKFEKSTTPRERGLVPPRRQLVIEDNVLSLDRPAIFAPTKDRPILFSALAWADVLLTLDSHDFGDLLGGAFYGLPVLRPGTFLEREHAMKRLR